MAQPGACLPDQDPRGGSGTAAEVRMAGGGFGYRVAVSSSLFAPELDVLAVPVARGPMNPDHGQGGRGGGQYRRGGVAAPLRNVYEHIRQPAQSGAVGCRGATGPDG